jgi:hypothetical protein
LLVFLSRRVSSGGIALSRPREKPGEGAGRSTLGIIRLSARSLST